MNSAIFDPGRAKYVSAWMDARAQIILDSALIAQVRKALRSKYGLLMRFTDFMATLTGRIHRRAYIEIEIMGS
jgi:hypothetical protein